MSDVKTLSERIDTLETRLTFQDETIETLNKTMDRAMAEDRCADASARSPERTPAGSRDARPRRRQRAAAALLKLHQAAGSAATMLADGCN